MSIRQTFSFSILFLAVTGILSRPAFAANPGNLPDGVFTPKIIGGRETPSDWPWMVALTFGGSADPAQAQFCAGTLIDPEWVLTAAHCAEFGSPGDIMVILGISNLRTDNTFERIPVREFFINPHYYNFGNDVTGDLALLRLDRPATGLTPLPLVDEPTAILPGTTGKALGWGLTSPMGSRSESLQEVDLPIQEVETVQFSCAFPSRIEQGIFNAGFPEGGRDACFGDSGGPFMVPMSNSAGWALAGVISSGSLRGCAAPDSYGRHTDVLFFRKWIFETMNFRFSTGDFFSTGGTLDSRSAQDPSRGGTYYAQDYSIRGLRSDGSFTVEIYSSDFSPRLTLINEADESVIDTVGVSGESLQLLTFQPAPNGRYTLRVSSMELQGSGGYYLSYPLSFLFHGLSGLRAISAALPFEDEFTETDTFDGDIYIKAYRLGTGQPGQTVTVRVDVDPEITGLKPDILVLDFFDGEIVASSFFPEGNSNEVTFVVPDDTLLIVSVAAFDPEMLGGFTITVTEPNHDRIVGEVAAVIDPTDNLFDNQFCTEWFGAFNADDFPWIGHSELGFVYLDEADSSGFWMWNETIGWLWTSEAIFPFIWSDVDQDWLWFYRLSTNPRWFFSFNEAAWVYYTQ